MLTPLFERQPPSLRPEHNRQGDTEQSVDKGVDVSIHQKEGAQHQVEILGTSLSRLAQGQNESGEEQKTDEGMMAFGEVKVEPRAMCEEQGATDGD